MAIDLSKCKFIFEIEGRPEATEQEVRDLVVRQFLRVVNRADILDGEEVTHYKGVALN